MSSSTKEKFLLTTKWTPRSFPLLTIALQFGPIDLLPTYTHYSLASFIYTFLIHFNSIPNELFAITKKQKQFVFVLFICINRFLKSMLFYLYAMLSFLKRTFLFSS